MYIHNTKIPIYGGTLKVIITEDPHFKDVNAKFNTTMCDSFGAVTFQDSYTGHYCIAFPAGVAYGSICHECCHVANMVFDYIGHKLDTKNDEAQCYLTGWLFEQVENAIALYNKKKYKK